MRRWSAGIAALLSCLAITGCGGGGEAGSGAQNSNIQPTQPSSPSAQGYWRGQSADGRTVQSWVLPDGVFYVFYSEPHTPGLLAGVVLGQGEDRSGSLSTNDALNFDVSESDIRQATLSATYNAGSHLGGSVTSGPRSLSFTSSYRLSLNRSANPSELVGDYIGVAATASGTQIATWTVESDGRLEGAYLGCQFEGQASGLGSLYAYAFTVTAQGPACATVPAGLSGLVFFDPETGTMQGVAPSTDGSNGFILAGVQT